MGISFLHTHPFSPLSSIFYPLFPPEVPPPLENATAAIFSYAVSHLDEGTGFPQFP